MVKKINTVSTARELIDALGGYRAVARKLDLEPRVVWNWYVRGLPMKRFFVLNRMAGEHGIIVPPSLWKMDRASA